MTFNRDPIVPPADQGTKENPILVRRRPRDGLKPPFSPTPIHHHPALAFAQPLPEPGPSEEP